MDNSTPRSKQVACSTCRKRKLRCDRRRPTCETCSRLGYECAYAEGRKKSGTKRNYMAQLEERLAQVETLLKPEGQPASVVPGNNLATTPSNNFTSETPSFGDNVDHHVSPPTDISEEDPASHLFEPAVETKGGWEMTSLGVEEPLPCRQTIDELNQIYFVKVHPSVPVIHPPRHLAASTLAPNVRLPICLQYIIWALAATVSEKYRSLHPIFYQRARKYAELEHMRGFGQGLLSVPYCQSWLLISTYEFRMTFFPRAWLSSGKASRLVLMLGLNCLDGPDPEVKQTLPGPRDWTEKEERRRVFWMAFCIDRYASAGTGWPVVFDERDIRTNVPASEEAFLSSILQHTLPVTDLLEGRGISTMSTFGSMALIATLFGQILSLTNRPDPNDNVNDLNSRYWQRHKSLDEMLLNVALAMSSCLLPDPNSVLCNMVIHVSVICLHQAAILKAQRNKVPEQVINDSKLRCSIAADQILNIMRTISHMDLSTMNPLVSLCIYVASRVFLQYLKTRPEDMAARSSLQFIFSALNALKHKNPLAESFLVQLEVDIDGTPFSDLHRPKEIISPEKKVSYKSKECALLLPLEKSDSLKPDKLPPSQQWTQETHSNWLHTLEDNGVMNPQLDAMAIPQLATPPTPDRMFATNTIPPLEPNEPEASMQVPYTWDFTIPSNTNTNTYDDGGNMEILFKETAIPRS